jgi:butanol dehydrogenase
MLGNFTFHNPTKLYFGENSLENLSKELGKYGEKVMLVYGGGSIRKNGIYDAVLAELRKAGKQTVELSGVMPNPTIEKVMEGVALARKEAVDFILAVGGGSVCDYCKAVAGSAYCEHDPWEYSSNAISLSVFPVGTISHTAVASWRNFFTASSERPMSRR